MRKLMVLGVVFGTLAAFAQEPPPAPPEGDFGPQRREGQGQRRGRDVDPQRRAKPQAGQKKEVEMAVHGDSVYVVAGSEIFRVDSTTMELGAKGKLEDPAEEAEMRERMMRKLDKNGDGQVTQDEFPRPEMFDRADRNGDGIITPDELRLPAVLARRRAGPVRIVVGKGAVYVLRGDVLFKLAPDDLHVLGTAKLEAEEEKERKRDRDRRPRDKGRPGREPGGARGGEFEF